MLCKLWTNTDKNKIIIVTEFAKTILLGTQFLATNFDFKG